MTPNIPSPDKAATRWFYSDAQNQAVGPIAYADLNKMALAGIITAETLVIPESGTEWQAYRLIAVTPPSVPPPIAPRQPTKARRWPAVLSVLCLYPLGLIVLWLNRGYDTKIKALITVVSALLFFVAIATGHAGLIILALAFNSSVFIWTAESLKKGVKVALSVFLGVIALPSLFVKPDMEPSHAATEATGSVDSLPKQTSGKTSESQQKAKMGQWFRLGDFSYRIYGCNMEQFIGNRYTNTQSAPNAVFLIIQYEIKNESNKTKTTLADDFSLRDAKGREFRPSSKAVTALMMTMENKDFIVSELQPGLAQETLTAFEVPFESTQSTLVLIVPEKGLLGSKQQEVLLSK